jgi:murein DD-endopeptidase MepM/ murein hydrolase activator NlpD
MPVFGDNQLDKIVEDLKSMFNRGDSYGRPTTPTTVPGGVYTAPLHASWRSSGGFTYQPNPTHPKGHMGVDMRVAAGTPVYPLTSGIVSSVGTDPMGGNVVNVQHGDNLRTYYAHLSTVKVHKGDKVDQNTVLGTVGNTGNASHTFPHLHFQVWQDNQIQDPARFFSMPTYTNLSAQELANSWTSEQAKQEAALFNMRDHLAARRAAFTSQVVKLSHLADEYYKAAVHL